MRPIVKTTFSVAFEEEGPVFVTEPKGLTDTQRAVIPTKIMMKIAVGHEIPEERLYGPVTSEDLENILLLYLPMRFIDPNSPDERMKKGGKFVVVFIGVNPDVLSDLLKKYDKLSQQLLGFFSEVKEFSEFKERVKGFDEFARKIIGNVLLELEIDNLVIDARIAMTVVLDNKGELIAKSIRTTLSTLPSEDDVFAVGLMGTKLLKHIDEEYTGLVSLRSQIHDMESLIFYTNETLIAFVLSTQVPEMSLPDIMAVCSGYVGKINALIRSRSGGESFKEICERVIPEAKCVVLYNEAGIPIDYVGKQPYEFILRISGTASTLSNTMTSNRSDPSIIQSDSVNVIVKKVDEKRGILVITEPEIEMNQLIPKVETLSEIICK